MKKIFSFFAVALLAMSSFAVDYKVPAETWTVGNTAALDAYKWNSVTVKGYAVVNDDWYVLCVYDLYKAGPSKQKWIDFTASGSTTKSWNANGIFQGITYYHNDGKAATGNTSRVYSYNVTNMSAVSLYGNSSDSSRYLVLAVYEGETLVASDSATNAIDTIITLEGFDKAKTYTVIAYGNTANNCNLYEIAFSVSGEEPEIDAKAIAPSFSVAAGEYFDPFKLALTTSEADAKIYCRINGAGDFAEYADSIEIAEYDTPYTIEAFATKPEALNSDTVVAQYLLTRFVPRTKFNARQVIKFAGLQEADIQILDPNSASIGSYEMDKVMCPTVNYKNQKTADGTKDSTMSISFAGKDGVNFVYKNKEDKNNIMICAPNFLVLNGSNFEMHLNDVQPGDTIVFVLTAKGATSPVFSHTYSTSANIDAYEPEDDEDPDYTDGEIYTKQDARVDDDYCGYSNLVYIVKEGKHTAKLKETKGGFRLAEILIGAYRGEEPSWEALETVNGAVKAVKTFENGQLVIIKNGVKYNVLGTAL